MQLHCATPGSAVPVEIPDAWWLQRCLPLAGSQSELPLGRQCDTSAFALASAYGEGIPETETEPHAKGIPGRREVQAAPSHPTPTPILSCPAYFQFPKHGVSSFRALWGFTDSLCFLKV